MSTRSQDAIPTRWKPDCRSQPLGGLIGVTRLLTADEVAERLGVTKDWVWAQARAGRIPHVQLGRYRRFREEALERWLEEFEMQSAGTGGPSGTRGRLSRRSLVWPWTRS